MTEQREFAAAEPPLDCLVRQLREGEVMMVYLHFDRHRDRAWSDAEYMLKFGEAVSAATVEANVLPNTETAGQVRQIVREELAAREAAYARMQEESKHR
jgi:hypothetical protein